MGEGKTRNELCICGSGVKYKNCCLEEKIDIKRNIPNHIKREVIKQLGPFCILCGLPSFEFHHIKQYSVLKSKNIDPHTVDNIIPLCEIHHRQFVHKDKITPEILKNKREELIKNPNIANSFFTQSVPPVIFLGNNKIVNTNNILVSAITREKIFFVDKKGGNILINARFQDQNNNDILVIRDNEWIIKKDNIWDLKVEMGEDENFNLTKNCARLIINTKDKKLNDYAGLDIQLIPNEGIKIINAKFYCFGSLLEINNDGTLIINKKIFINNSLFNNCGGAFAF